MKMGEIRALPDALGGGFTMQTPDGVRDVTLRCRHDGVVCVEEVSGGGMSITPLVIHNYPEVNISSEQRVDLETLRREDQRQRAIE